MALNDTQQYPNSTAPRRLLPTIAGYKVTKFKDSNGYEEMEKLKDENGVPFLYNGVNLEYNYDIEMIPLGAYTMPVELTAMTFAINSSPNAFVYPGAYSGSIHILVVGKVESAQDEAGKVAKIAFKGVTSANIP